MPTNSKQIRSRTFTGQRNYEYETHILNEDGTKSKRENAPTQEQWKELIINELFKEKVDYAYLALVFHDRDVDKSDPEHHKIKGLHCHFVVNYKNARSYEETKARTKCQERNFDKTNSQSGSLRYLTHTTDKAMADEKVRYEVKELYVIDNTGNFPNQFLQGEDLETWYRTKIKSTPKATTINPKLKSRFLELSFMVYKGELKPDKICDILKEEFDDAGWELYRKERKRLQEDYLEFLENKRTELKGTGRTLRTIFIEGESETGKSHFARDLAAEINLRKGYEITDTYNVSSKQKNRVLDWIAKYKDEHITLFDDVEPEQFEFTQFLKTFETKLIADISSRYKDKSWFSEYAIITKSMPIEQYVNTICKSELYSAKTPKEISNIKYQVKRRIKLVILVEKNKLTIRTFNKQGGLETLRIFKYKDTKEFWHGEIRKHIINECIELIETEDLLSLLPNQNQNEKVENIDLFKPVYDEWEEIANADTSFDDDDFLLSLDNEDDLFED